MKVPKFWGRRLVQCLFYVVGGALAGLAIVMVWKFGETLGASEFERLIYGAAHAVVHVFGILVALSIALFVFDKSKTWAGLAIVLVLVVGGYGMLNIGGFLGKNRIAVSDAVTTNNDRAMAEYMSKKTDLENRRNWAGNIVVNADYPVAERNAAKREKNEYQKQLEALKMPTVTAATVSGDAAMTVYARLADWDAQRLQSGMVAWFALLMYVCEVASFIFGTRIGAGVGALQAVWWEAHGPPPGATAPVKSVGVSANDNRKIPATPSDDEEEEEAAAPPVPVRAPAAATLSIVPVHISQPSPAEQAAKADLLQLLAEQGPIFSQTLLASRWSADEGVVSRWLRLWSSEGLIARKRVGNRSEIHLAGGVEVGLSRRAA